MESEQDSLNIMIESVLKAVGFLLEQQKKKKKKKRVKGEFPDEVSQQVQ